MTCGHSQVIALSDSQNHWHYRLLHSFSQKLPYKFVKPQPCIHALNRSVSIDKTNDDEKLLITYGQAIQHGPRHLYLAQSSRIYAKTNWKGAVMIKKIILAACILSSAITVNSNLVVSAEKESRKPASTDVEKGNTKINKQDRKEGEVTADQQGESKSDIEMSKNIRTAVITDKLLSQYAHNIKIITRDGKVTLKGPIKSEQEKKQ
ncbi:MAG TPA: hypothetical protein VGJ93_13435 [Desulfuromonadaceae bacterium]